MIFYPPGLFTIGEPSAVGDARRRAVALASMLGFDDTDQGRVALVVTELGTNLLLHGGGGDLIFQPCWGEGEKCGLEITVVDQGPGISDLSSCMRDGYSTKGTSGNGLGAVARLADSYDVFSRPEAGTAVLARLWQHRQAPAAHPLVVGAVALSMPGESVCGDTVFSYVMPERGLFMVADGLGHGQEAAEASQKAVQALRAHCDLNPGAALGKIHTALANTRGAVVAVAQIDLREKLVCYAGIGNIASYIENGERMFGMVSQSGIVGHLSPRIREYTYPWSSSSLLVMQSDGIKSRYYLNEQPGLARCDPALIAAITLHRGKRLTDDATVLVVSQHRELSED